VLAVDEHHDDEHIHVDEHHDEHLVVDEHHKDEHLVDDQDEHLHQQLEDWDMRHRLLWMVWNGDMEMTCEGARPWIRRKLRLAGLLLLLLLHLPLLVEDLLGLSVADEEDDGGEDEDDGAPGATVAKPE